MSEIRLPFNATLYMMKSIENVMKMLRFFLRHQLQLKSCKVTKMVKLSGAW